MVIESEELKQSYTRRDRLREIHRTVTNIWEKNHIYQAERDEKGKETFFCTFPYPYMNGKVHLGHAFTISKAEFQARYQRLKGKNVLWPFGFHCTGMPIVAAAEKLKHETGTHSSSGVACPLLEDEFDKTEGESSECYQNSFKGKKSKTISKIGGAKTQHEIMKALGIPESELGKFINPEYWLTYFPPIAMGDLKGMGLAVDWRRSFITTTRNKYYDAFIMWQFRKLYERGYVKSGVRPSVFSIAENQPCADHERSVGEGVVTQASSLIKLRLKTIPSQLKDLESTNIFLLAATLRPETVYGATNCFVHPSEKYGAYWGLENDCPKNLDASGVCRIILENQKQWKSEQERPIFVCSESSALNMCYQGILPLFEKDEKAPIPILNIPGADLIGHVVEVPVAITPEVYVLPMMTIAMNKGTGIVLCVPSDSPDDFAALMDLNRKAELRIKYKVDANMIGLSKMIDIIQIPGYSPRPAEYLYNKFNIKSQNDKELLKKAKEEIYKKGFYEGILLTGPYAGRKVREAKSIIKDGMILNNQLISYHELESEVVSRSGDACIVALCYQWYIDYGDEGWKQKLRDYLKCKNSSFTAFSENVSNQLDYAINWLREWACSRERGLGSFLPWELDKGKKYLIESLSDSTIYMAYYTIAHLLQGDIFGDKAGILGIEPGMLKDEDFDYIFLLRDDVSANSLISLDSLKRLRSEFQYWYPFSLRVSGKDLICNHLSMCLFNHAAIWQSNPLLWPRGFFCNGFVLVDAAKMSKSLGNFITVEEAVENYTADGMRVALADAGDSLDDANFQRDNATSAVMRLYLLDLFASEILNTEDLREGNENWADMVLVNEVIRLCNIADQAYGCLEYRAAIKAALFDFTILRDRYRLMLVTAKMHRPSILFWLECLCVILCPIAPHICEYIWSIKMKKETLVVEQPWPVFKTGKYEAKLHSEYKYLFDSLGRFRKTIDNSLLGKRSKKNSIIVRNTISRAEIVVKQNYSDWQNIVLSILHSISDTLKNSSNPENSTSPENFTTPAHSAVPEEIHGNQSPKKECFNEEKTYMNSVKNNKEIQALNKKTYQEAMSFAKHQIKLHLKYRDYNVGSPQPLFNEKELLESNLEFLKSSLGLENLRIVRDEELANGNNVAQPLLPVIFIYSD